MFFVVLFFYNYKFKEDKKSNVFSKILATVISITLSLGKITSMNLYISGIGFLQVKNISYILIMFFGFFSLFYKLFKILFGNLNKIKIISKNNILSKKELILIFIGIFLMWAIFFLRYFPAIMTEDSFSIIHFVTTKALNDTHTFGFTWFFGTLYYLGSIFFKSANACIAVYTIFQMLLMDLIFVLSIRYFSRKGLKKSLAYTLAIFIAINPLFSHYSVTLWRDILFSMSFVVIVLLLYDYINNKYEIKIKNVILFTLAIIVSLFFRNNGIYVFFIIAPFLILIGKKQRLAKLIYCISIIIIYFIIKGPIFDYFNIEKGAMSEAYSIPIQQISRVVASGEKIDSDTYKFLSKVYNIDSAKIRYLPIISNNMKGTINIEYLEGHKVEFFKTYLELLIKYPTLYFEAYFTQTVGYWYPDINYWSVGGANSSMFEKNVKSTPVFNNSINTLLDQTLSKKIPFSFIIWSLGFNFYLLLISTAISIYKNGKNHILYYVPIYAVWFSLMIATPVYCELRYIFCMFAVMPFLLILPFMKKNTIKNI